MAGTWINRVRHVSDGEAVSGAIDSRPTRSLEGNAQYLKDRIDSAELGEGVCAYGETVEPDALVGMAVYRNIYGARYERALAAVGIDPTTGVMFPAASSDVVGIIVFKYNATKADILLAGRRQVDISAAVLPGEAWPGRYYLSSAEPGMLVQQRPPVSVSVLVYTDDGMAIVQPIQRNFMEDHIHYKVRLFAQPAGTNHVNGQTNRNEVGSPDPSLPGWLPANHAIFNDRAPTGAAFGYNLSQHPQLARIFPPLPPSGAVIFLDRGEDYAGGTLVPMGPGGLCAIDSFGIWWMSDCPGDTPWPETWTEPTDPLTGNPSDGPECPRMEEFQIILSYTMMVFTTERTTVTSLQPADGSPLTFTNCDGDEAKTGDLYAGLNLEFLATDDAPDGYMAFKDLNVDGSNFQRGPIVEGLLAGPRCSLAVVTGQGSTQETDAGTLYQGRVVVNVDTAPPEQELPADLVRLAQTQERFYLDIPYIGFDAGRDTSLRMRFYVPPDPIGLPASPQVAIRMQLLGRATALLPVMTLTYRILSRPLPPTSPPPVVPATPVSLPGLTLEQALIINTNVPITTDYYTEVQSNPIPVTAGDTILVTLTRSSTDGYAGEVGLMRPVGILTSGV